MDARLEFLSEETGGEGADLPVNTSFTNRTEGAAGEVALQYWPPRQSGEPPKHLLLYILGRSLVPVILYDLC